MDVIKYHNNESWDINSINIEKIYHKLELTAIKELKIYSDNKQFEKKIISNDNFIKSFKYLSQKLNLLTEEVKSGQGFKILSLPPDINYYDLQYYFWIIINLLGEPLVQNKEGDRLVFVYDRDRYKTISDGARYHQTHEGGSIHTDNVNIPEKWNYLLVCCFEPAITGGESIIVNGIKVYEYLLNNSEDVIETLCNNFFWEYRGISENLYEAPIITFDNNNRPVFRYLRTYLESAHIKANKKLNEKQLYALDTLDAVLNMSNHCIRIKLNKGDIMLINDETILHDRECFVDKLDSSNIIDYFSKINSNEICRTLGRAWVK